MPSRWSALQPSELRKTSSPWALDRQVLSVPCHHLLLPVLTESAVQLALYLLSSTHFPKRKSEVL